MAREQHASNTTLNFDGLTDVVTNLVGALILLVILLFGLTTEARVWRGPPAVQEEEEEALVLPESFVMSKKEVITSYHQFAEAWRLTVILVIVSCLVGMSLTTGLYAGSINTAHR